MRCDAKSRASVRPFTDSLLGHVSISSQGLRFNQFRRLFKVKMERILVPLAFLPLLLSEAVILNSFTVTSYRKAAKTIDGPAMCALDPADDTTASSSLQDCSLRCSQDAVCAGFNIKNWVTCAVFNYKPSIKERDTTCEFYQVFTILIFSCQFTFLLRHKLYLCNIFYTFLKKGVVCSYTVFCNETMFGASDIYNNSKECC